MYSFIGAPSQIYGCAVRRVIAPRIANAIVPAFDRAMMAWLN